MGPGRAETDVQRSTIVWRMFGREYEGDARDELDLSCITSDTSGEQHDMAQSCGHIAEVLKPRTTRKRDTDEETLSISKNA